MSTAIQVPPVNTPLTGQNGQIHPLWSRFFVKSQQVVTSDVAPADGPYVTTTANAQLTNEVNLGALSAGYLKQTVAAGVASPSTTSTIPASDIVAAGSDTEVQINDGGALGATSLLTINVPNSAVELHGALVSDADILTLGVPGAPTANQTIQPAASTSGSAGAPLNLLGGAGVGADGGAVYLQGGNSDTGAGGSFTMQAGNASAAGQSGGRLSLSPGASGAGGQAGSILLTDENGTTLLLLNGPTAPTKIQAFQPITGTAFIGDGSQLTYAVVAVTFGMSPYVVLASDSTLLVDATGGAVTITLPTATTGRILCVKKTDASANAVTLTGTVDGVANPTLTVQWQSRIIQGDGANWMILGQV